MFALFPRAPLNYPFRHKIEASCTDLNLFYKKNNNKNRKKTQKYVITITQLSYHIMFPEYVSFDYHKIYMLDVNATYLNGDKTTIFHCQ
jgi:hypothetical protein